MQKLKYFGDGLIDILIEREIHTCVTESKIQFKEITKNRYKGSLLAHLSEKLLIQTNTTTPDHQE